MRVYACILARLRVTLLSETLLYGKLIRYVIFKLVRGSLLFKEMLTEVKCIYLLPSTYSCISQ